MSKEVRLAEEEWTELHRHRREIYLGFNGYMTVRDHRQQLMPGSWRTKEMKEMNVSTPLRYVSAAIPKAVNALDVHFHLHLHFIT